MPLLQRAPRQNFLTTRCVSSRATNFRSKRCAHDDARDAMLEAQLRHRRASLQDADRALDER